VPHQQIGNEKHPYSALFCPPVHLSLLCFEAVAKRFDTEESVSMVLLSLVNMEDGKAHKDGFFVTRNLRGFAGDWIALDRPARERKAVKFV
jgi:hypothetical protein